MCVCVSFAYPCGGSVEYFSTDIMSELNFMMMVIITLAIVFYNSLYYALLYTVTDRWFDLY